MQEDVTEIARRKMLQEEPDVDIHSVDPEPKSEFQFPQTGGNGELDEDFAWADQEPDDDDGNWRMKTIMEDDDEMG
jgi:COMPASS component SWD1